MQQLVVMKAATSTVEDKHYVLAPLGYAAPDEAKAQQAAEAGISQIVPFFGAREASLAPITGHGGGKRPRFGQEWEEVTPNKGTRLDAARNRAAVNHTDDIATSNSYFCLCQRRKFRRTIMKCLKMDRLVMANQVRAM
ncbi:TPA: hypothetical protein ACH3X1_013579 [Trebouxia sp. C0004]